MSCCPEESFGSLDNQEYKARGKVESYNGVDFYRVGEGERCVIWNYDVFGFDGGRTRQTCDFLADKGFLVILPDFFRGLWQDPSKDGIKEFMISQSQWKDLKVDWEDRVVPYARKHGAKVFGCVGTCWGSYNVLRQSGYDDVKCGVSIHPSHSVMIELLKECEDDILSSVNCPQLFLSAGNDHINCQPEGLAKEILQDNLTLITFPDMVHGWATRGDMSDPTIKRDVTKAIKLMTEFIITHVKL